jgi:hypothetical protein
MKMLTGLLRRPKAKPVFGSPWIRRISRPGSAWIHVQAYRFIRTDGGAEPAAAGRLFRVPGDPERRHAGQAFRPGGRDGRDGRPPDGPAPALSLAVALIHRPDLLILDDPLRVDR